MSHYLFTSESVSCGHPDKVADQISDALLDLYLKEDKFAKTAFETLVTTNRVILAGEKRTSASISKEGIEDTVRSVIKKIGYEQDGFHWKNAEIHNHLHKQSVDIAKGVDLDRTADQGAGDQGIMFGYACSETDRYMPAPLFYSHQLLKAVKAKRLGELSGVLGPDAKAQITMRYENKNPVGIEKVLISTQHHESYDQKGVRDLMLPIIYDTLPKEWMCSEDDILVNPTGRFVIGGPDGDAGLTGRKIIVDTYGGVAPHGGGAFSGKDPSKVDRSAAYMARYVAKNIVASGLADHCCVQLSYAIGVAKPLSIYVYTYGTGKVSESEIVKFIDQNIDLTPKGIETTLDLLKPIYEKTASYGHFGRSTSDEGHFSWEKLNLVDTFKKLLA